MDWTREFLVFAAIVLAVGITCAVRTRGAEECQEHNPLDLFRRTKRRPMNKCLVFAIRWWWVAESG